MDEQKSILVVEDNTSLFAMYKVQLNMNGYEVVHAKNALEGLEAAKNTSPDMILLDLKLPGEMQGDEMLEEMRAEDWGETIPVIVLTNVSRSEAPQSLRFLNVEDFVVKILTSPPLLVQIINNAFRELKYREQF